MQKKNVWFITGASRGMGVNFAQSALAAGHSVAATGRNADRVAAAIGAHENLLPLALDVTDPTSVEEAVKAAVDRFGRIDVLVNNAGTSYNGFFETLSPEQVRAQMETNFFGTLNVTRSVLPLLRSQRSGQIITVTSVGGFTGGPSASIYCASKFALEGWMEALGQEVESFGIETMAVEPGYFRTELLVEGASTTFAELHVEDYAEATAATIEGFRSMNGQQPGDPAKLADALVVLSDEKALPKRFIAGADAIEAIEHKQATVQQQIDAHRELSTSLNFSS